MPIFKKERTALALAGGGARGAYHLGVWRALRELNVKFDIVTGTSVGALTGGIIVEGDYEAAERIFCNIKNSDVMELPDDLREVGDFIKYVTKNGGLDVRPLANLVESCVHEDNVRKSGIDFGMVIVKRSDLSPMEVTLKDIPKGELIKYMLASASIFPFFTSQDIGGSKYIDGGLFNNLPISLAEDMGATSIIAVDLEAWGVEKQYTGGLPVRYIRPSWPLGSIVNFDAETSRKNLMLGYLDAMRAYQRYDGFRYAIERGELAKYKRTGAVLSCAKANLELAPQLASRAAISSLIQDYDAHRNDRRMLMALAESAAYVMELDPLKPYAFEELNRAIVEAYRKSPPLSIKLGKSISADISRRSAAVTMVNAMDTEKPSAELTLLAGALPRELAAAAYISALLNAGIPACS